MNLSPSTRAPIFDPSLFNCLRPILDEFDHLKGELESADLRWQEWAAEGHAELVHGDWSTAPVYRGNATGHGRRPKPRPRMDRQAWNRFAAEVRSLPAKLRFCHAVFGDIPEINFVGMSRLGPRSWIEPHAHANDDSLILHVLLEAEPGRSGIAVGGQRVVWERPGHAAVFDDNLAHFAWNDAATPRTLLHVDFSPGRL